MTRVTAFGMLCLGLTVSMSSLAGARPCRRPGWDQGFRRSLRRHGALLRRVWIRSLWNRVVLRLWSGPSQHVGFRTVLAGSRNIPGPCPGSCRFPVASARSNAPCGSSAFEPAVAACSTEVTSSSVRQCSGRSRFTKDVGTTVSAALAHSLEASTAVS